jgi:hypothetical protein
MKSNPNTSQSLSTHLLGEIYSILIREGKKLGDMPKISPSGATEGDPKIPESKKSIEKET